MYNIIICCTMYNVHCTYYNYTYDNFVTAFILFPINKLKTDTHSREITSSSHLAVTKAEKELTVYSALIT